MKQLWSLHWNSNLSSEVPRRVSPFAIRSINLNGYDEISIIELYQLHVQGLFNYGMQVCSNRELVTDSLQALYAHVRSQHDLPREKKSVRLFLFKNIPEARHSTDWPKEIAGDR